MMNTNATQTPAELRDGSATPPTVEEWPFRNDTELGDLPSRLVEKAPPVLAFEVRR